MYFTLFVFIYVDELNLLLTALCIVSSVSNPQCASSTRGSSEMAHQCDALGQHTLK